MKRIIAIIAILFAVLPVFSGCSKISAEIGDLRSEIAALSDRALALGDGQVADLEKRIDSLKEEIEALKTSDSVQQEAVDALKKELSDISSELSNVKDTVLSLGDTSDGVSADVAQLSSKMEALSSEITVLFSELSALEDKVLSLGGMVALTYRPTCEDRVETVLYKRNVLKISGTVTLKFDVQPQSAAETLAKNFRSVLSAKAAYISGDGSPVNLSVTGARAQDGILSVDICTDNLNRDFIFSKTSAVLALVVSLGESPFETEYINLNTVVEEKALITYLLNTFDSDGDGQVNDMNKVTSINLSDYGLSTIDGILSGMSSLETLDCSKNSLKSLDLKNNPALKSLNASGNSSLSKVDLSANSSLSTINLSGDSALSALDLSRNTSLTSLDVSKTVLKSLDVSKCSLLSSLNLSGVTALGSLNVSGTALKTLDISSNSALTALNYTEGLPITSGFSVGRYIAANGVAGVAFSVSGTTVKIVSAAETAKNWTEGKEWCTGHGAKWYMPSLEEMKVIYENQSVINTSLLEKKATAFTRVNYWSATMENGYTAYYLNFDDGSAADPTSPTSNISYSYLVRAVRVL